MRSWTSFAGFFARDSISDAHECSARWFSGFFREIWMKLPQMRLSCGCLGWFYSHNKIAQNKKSSIRTGVVHIWGLSHGKKKDQKCCFSGRRSRGKWEGLWVASTWTEYSTVEARFMAINANVSDLTLDQSHPKTKKIHISINKFCQWQEIYYSLRERAFE